MKPALGIIGAGKVGSVLARLWHKANYRIEAVYSRTMPNSRRLADTVDAVAVSSANDVVRIADLTVLSVPDDVIQHVADELYCDDWTDKAIIHTSGVHDRQVLMPLAAQGASTGSFHPVFPFADVEKSLETFPGATVAVEAEDERLSGWLRDLVKVLDGQVIEVPPGGKAIYHAALVIASNYTVSLYATAERLLTGLGAERAIADHALNTLVAATLENIRKQGIPKALTGPLARADTGTLRMHLDALDQQDDPVLASVYRDLARLSIPLLQARGMPRDVIERLERVLSQDGN